jgi:hypothetical protein
MVDVQIKLSAAWVALTLTYLLGAVLRICSDDFIVFDLLTAWFAWNSIGQPA